MDSRSSMWKSPTFNPNDGVDFSCFQIVFFKVEFFILWIATVNFRFTRSTSPGLLVHKFVDEEQVTVDGRGQEEKNYILFPMRNQPISIRNWHSDAEKLEAVRDVPMPHVEQVHHQLDYTNLPNDLLNLCRPASTAFRRFSQGITLLSVPGSSRCSWNMKDALYIQ